MRRYLEGKLKLKMNVEKSRVVSVFSARNFKFLGFALGKGRKDVYVVKSNMVYSGVQTWHTIHSLVIFR